MMARLKIGQIGTSPSMVRLQKNNIMTRQSIIPMLAVEGLLSFAMPRSDAPIAQDKQSVTFKDSIAPLLKANCTPCHFKGGKVYDRLPFERYETVRSLGKKLNTRLKDEKAEMVIRWIEQGYPK